MAENLIRDFKADTVAALKENRVTAARYGLDTAAIDEKLAAWGEPVEKKDEPSAQQKAVPAPPATASKPVVAEAKRAPAKAAAPAAPAKEPEPVKDAAPTDAGA
ncbi:Uncharacterised protein [Mycobacteroides abscessus subsp. massiliense]|uniref:hypothetical protein n=1 Tax=Mycobacteroides abscessus TaxID=36809 RepID=UPI0009A62084|nr:hypothetical protein [Mycobacteroides abscessus]SKM81092.1 Uncharacterised protein [Mycobacteroides abscessus subsp. massiliense]SKM97540.1 Uncharacterised protein [Mycobacteroides abscessus subsp. massiliense]SKN76433.1 Uncharacterised protein [Mycobacteroides abscessus subsp. massiliense]SKN96724.1 Uncharacterised protein [Mycobacteroides abscessus subsp. massiliense]SKO21090.1 Uncharacterised protein [Mycobacteroides abscessus subsp. massiliense]